MGEVTRIFERGRREGFKTGEELLPLLYEELRQLAAAKLAREVPGQTLQATALVHEAWLRLIAPEDQKLWENRAHFFGAAAEAMRRILIDRARSKQAQRHGGGLERVELEELDIPEQARDEILLRVHEVLDGLEREDAQAAELVKLRYFAGLSAEEAAATLGISERTSRRYWRFARAWLRDQMGAEP